MPLFLEAEPRFGDLLEAIERLAPSLLAIGEDQPPAPRWRQDWFPRLDAAAAYAIIQARAPALLVEVGSGHSTRWFARAAADAGHATRIVAIDPAPRATLAGLSIELVRSTVQEAGEAPFAPLTTGDVLSIDGSHVLMPGTDVDILLNRVLPVLPAGVLVHIHDVFLPEGYPAEWAWRGYNEQPAVALMLQGCGYRVLWSSHWVGTRLEFSSSRVGPCPPAAAPRRTRVEPLVGEAVTLSELKRRQAGPREQPCRGQARRRAPRAPKSRPKPDGCTAAARRR